MRSKPSAIVRDTPTFTETARRAQIIECAIRTIAELGYAHASLAEIARRAGISKSVISYYFPTKDELIQQIVSDVFDAFTAYMLPQIQAQSSVRDALRTYIRTNVAFMGENRHAVLAMVEIVSGYRDAAGKSFLDETQNASAFAALEELLHHGQDAGEFRPFSTEVMAFAIRWAIDALPPRLAARPDLDIDQYASELADLFDLATAAPPAGMKTRARGQAPSARKATR